MPRTFPPPPEDSDAALLVQAMKDMKLSPVVLSQISGYAAATIYAYRRDLRPVPAPLWKFLALLRAYRDLRKMRRDVLAKALQMQELRGPMISRKENPTP